MALHAALKQYWGYDSFRPLQKEAMLHAMQRRDSLVVLPTGGGKSLCYQVPAVCLDGMAVVISPLISLMKDQVDALQACGIPAAFVNSTLSPGQRRQVAQQVRSGQLKLLFIAPERIVQETTVRFLQRANVSFIAIDEAHCISHWGHDFRPEYRQLGTLRAAFPGVAFHAFTATATERVRQDICDQMKLTDPAVLVGSVDRPNLTYRVRRRHDTFRQVEGVLERHRGESGIIYCISRSSVDDLSGVLNDRGYRARPYHAGLDSDTRRRHQEAFVRDEVDIIVATVAFGMGIDKSNVRFVIHAEMPRSIEAWQQESGRAGRDGLEAECCLFFSERDVRTWEFLIEQSEAASHREASLQALAAMEAVCIGRQCRHVSIRRHFGEQPDKDNCGACDVCLQETDTVPDSQETACRILSGVFRQGQNFGAAHTVLVLRGSRSRKVFAHGHERLSTWGILKDEPEHVVRGWIDQLVSEGCLERVGEYGTLRITPAGWQVLRGQRGITLMRPRPERHRAPAGLNREGGDPELFERLRRLRRRLARERGVPPYVIFGDVTLKELALEQPDSQDRMLAIHGIGRKKMEQYGSLFLEAIRTWQAVPNPAEDHQS